MKIESNQGKRLRVSISNVRTSDSSTISRLLPSTSAHLHLTLEMSKRDHACSLLKQGNSPSEIARLLRVRTSDVLHDLWSKIGEGELRRSDIAFSLKRDVRQAIEQVVARKKTSSPAQIARELEKRGMRCDRFDIRVYLAYRRAPVVLGEMYEIVRSVEVRLHLFVKALFIHEFGEEEWWRSGVPDNIRAECAALREKDPDPAPEPYNYTHLIALREILDRKWAIVSRYLPAAAAQNKKELLERLLQLNRIRNNVMHPVRGGLLTEDEFEFVYNLEADLGSLAVPESRPVSEEVVSKEKHVAEGKQSEEKLRPEKEEASPGSAAEPPLELVSKLSPTSESAPPQEFAATAQQAGGEDFIPSVKVS